MLILWILTLHVISVICWFAALFYLPRLFVYHASCSDHIGNERFKIMERKLFNGIMLPSALLSLITGYTLIDLMHWTFSNAPLWLHLKLLLVLLLFIFMVFCWKFLRDFKFNRNTRSHRFYRYFNEIPTVLLVLIVILVIIKPF